MAISFSYLLWWGAAVAGIGLLFLVLLIPASAYVMRSSEAKTEFYSARASYWCVICGLAVVLAAAFGAAIANAIKAAR